MRIPGFTADAAVYRSRRHYRPGPSRGGPARTADLLVPSARSGRNARPRLESLCTMECRGVCLSSCQRAPHSRECRACMDGCYADCPTEWNL